MKSKTERETVEKKHTGISSHNDTIIRIGITTPLSTMNNDSPPHMPHPHTSFQFHLQVEQSHYIQRHNVSFPLLSRFEIPSLCFFHISQLIICQRLRSFLKGDGTKGRGEEKNLKTLPSGCWPGSTRSLIISNVIMIRRERSVKCVRIIQI